MTRPTTTSLPHVVIPKAVKGHAIHLLVECSLLGHGACTADVTMPDGKTYKLWIGIQGAARNPLLNHWGDH